MLQGKHIVLGVTGSIAAYKAALLVRGLVKAGAEVRVVMTPLAKAFITPLTMATLSKHPIMVDFYQPENGDWNSHVSLGLWADLLLIAPATANTIAKMANGIADNLLLTTYLSAKCPVMIAPAMDVDMFQHEATQNNLHLLQQRGHQIIAPKEGELASGLVGAGRFEEPEIIIQQIETFFSKEGKLHGKKIMVTAGPTFEPIDPVRFIGNYSSGKMGIALAEEAAARGADVTLICGAIESYPSYSNIKVVKTKTAKEMETACLQHFSDCDIAIKAAAVADFTPMEVAEQKIKKHDSEEAPIIRLKPTTDILATLGKLKTDHQILVGFALETEKHREHALQKMAAKNLNFIVLNDAKTPGAGFGCNTNEITILFPDGKEQHFDKKSKHLVAQDILNTIENLLSN
ncbi:MAG: bifunctional phosphopantothenoylcysteine decarboxylase/phosphopantothenate--cysteine ligase CoaBC [Bacteroidales bacterium]|nr:bifunctional phosphopantothenoylcysteine decarboxylase/phosphopantothenate--cysteine ligase CoaBC [Bacteroidales bacterium]